MARPSDATPGDATAPHGLSTQRGGIARQSTAKAKRRSATRWQCDARRGGAAALLRMAQRRHRTAGRGAAPRGRARRRHRIALRSRAVRSRAGNGDGRALHGRGEAQDGAAAALHCKARQRKCSETRGIETERERTRMRIERAWAMPSRSSTDGEKVTK